MKIIILMWIGGLLIGIGTGSKTQKKIILEDAMRNGVAQYNSKTGEAEWILPKDCEE